VSHCDVVVRDLVADRDRASAGRPRASAELASPSLGNACAIRAAAITCEGDGDSERPALAADGGSVAYTSDAPSLVDGDGNRRTDVFKRAFIPGLRAEGLDFGTVTIGDSASRTATAQHVGFGPLGVAGVQLGGADAGDFAVVQDDCTDQRLHSEGSCQVAVRFTPTAAGERRAELAIAHTGAPTPLVVPLRGNATTPIPEEPKPEEPKPEEPKPEEPQPEKPELQANPGVVPPGRVTTIAGRGFAPNATVTVTGFTGSSTVTADGSGKFTLALHVLPNTTPGTRTITARAGVQGAPVTTTVLVVPSTVGPPDFVGRR
jgi:hypothetical protein